MSTFHDSIMSILESLFKSGSTRLMSCQSKMSHYVWVIMSHHWDSKWLTVLMVQYIGESTTLQFDHSTYIAYGQFQQDRKWWTIPRLQSLDRPMTKLDLNIMFPQNIFSFSWNLSISKRKRQAHFLNYFFTEYHFMFPWKCQHGRWNNLSGCLVPWSS